VLPIPNKPKIIREVKTTVNKVPFIILEVNLPIFLFIELFLSVLRLLSFTRMIIFVKMIHFCRAVRIAAGY